MPQPTISAGLARGLIQFAVEKGADQHQLTARAGINASDLEDQDNRIGFEHYVTLMHAAQELCGDPALALHYGETVDLSEVSIVGLIMNAAATMGDAFVQLQRFSRLALDVEGVSSEARFELAQRDGQIWMVDTRANPNAFPELTEVAFARLVCGPRRFLPAKHVLQIAVTHPAPAYASEYERVFQCPVEFSSPWNAMRLEPQIATWRVALQPHYVFGVLTERADTLLKELENTQTTRGHVEALLLPILHTGDVSADAIAGEMGFSRQTLFRKLKTENTTYESVLDSLRHRMALHYLSGKKSSVNETAYLVGFSDPASFSRAFKRWTGKSPREVRALKA